VQFSIEGTKILNLQTNSVNIEVPESAAFKILQALLTRNALSATIANFGHRTAQA
jgi:hypothetical protein